MDALLRQLREREHAYLKEMRDVRSLAQARLRALRAQARAAQRCGNDEGWEYHRADLGTLVLGLWWLRQEIRMVEARLAITLADALLHEHT